MGIPKEELRIKLNDVINRGKLRKIAPYYYVLPYSPGGFRADFN